MDKICTYPMCESKCCWHKDDKPCPKHVAATFNNTSFQQRCKQFCLFKPRKKGEVKHLFQMNMNDTVYDDTDNSSANGWVQ